MADQKVSELSALGVAPASGDMLYLVDISEATAADKSKYLLISSLFDSPTITTPTIADFTNMTHDHSDAAAGGEVDYATVFERIVTMDGDFVFYGDDFIWY
jgi:hypothetical protein